jgi:glycosyltransferase involved in cell wall biosynthesis
MAMPSISVLLPVRNAAPWLRASLASLWRQSVRDFEVIAVNDGSTDDSGEMLDDAAGHEPRLRVFHTAHRGLPTALNTGLAQARGTLIARHDADDLSHRRRFEWQRALLDAEPGVAVAGGRLRMFPAADTRQGMARWTRWHNSLLTHEEMAREVLIDSPLAHGTAMIRRTCLEQVGGWHERGWAEDLDLWVRLLRAGARFAKRPEVLYGWRQHPGSATWRDPRYERERFNALKLEALRLDFLRNRTEASVVGVSESLERACAAIASLGVDVTPVVAGRATPGVIERIRLPAILVFMSPVARLRWRTALENTEWREGEDFIFVA